MVVGVSISEPPDAERVELGLDRLHLRETFKEVVRHILGGGWSVAYGGDLRRSGYTEALFDLQRIYKHPRRSGPECVTSYLPWPVWVGRDPEEDVKLANIAKLVRCPAPDGAPETLPPLPERTSVDLFFAASAASRMRSDMTAGIDRRLVIGGRVSGQVGLIPGVIEEAVYAINYGVPLYVVGGVGGGGRVLAEALDGEKPPEMTLDYQLTHNSRYGELLGVAASHGASPNFDDIVELLAATGMSGLNNGLDENDNRRLVDAHDVDQIMLLVKKGFHQLEEDGVTPLIGSPS